MRRLRDWVRQFRRQCDRLLGRVWEEEQHIQIEDFGGDTCFVRHETITRVYDGEGFMIRQETVERFGRLHRSRQ